MKFTCPHCEKVLNVKDEYAGRKAKCPGCGESIVIEAPGDPEPASEPKAAVPAAGEGQSTQPSSEEGFEEWTWLWLKRMAIINFAAIGVSLLLMLIGGGIGNAHPGDVKVGRIILVIAVLECVLDGSLAFYYSRIKQMPGLCVKILWFVILAGSIKTSKSTFYLMVLRIFFVFILIVLALFSFGVI
ncbi:hypothetical protein ACFL6F_01730 [Planctomycetota bacterium]